MLAEGTFPIRTNIAYLLFLDIVEWYSTESNTKMRYSELVIHCVTFKIITCFAFVYGRSTVIKIEYVKATSTFNVKTACLIPPMIIAATSTGNKTWLAANCTVSNMMGPKQSSIYFD